MYYVEDMQALGFICIQKGIKKAYRNKVLVIMDVFYNDKTFEALAWRYLDGRPMKIVKINNGDKDKMIEVARIMAHGYKFNINGISTRKRRRYFTKGVRIAALIICFAGVIKSLNWFFIYGPIVETIMGLLIAGVCFFVALKLRV